MTFGYKCQECGNGSVIEKVIHQYRTKVRGYPFIVPSAHVGICNVCGAEHFNARETKRWVKLFEEEHSGQFLSAEQIVGLRKDLGLSMERFAFLIGCTRQSLHNWEQNERARTQSRMADLLLKLVRESRDHRQVDVLRFLVGQAQQFGVEINLDDKDPGPMHVWHYLASASKDDVSRLAASSVDSAVHLVDAETDQTTGYLLFDFKSEEPGIRLHLDGEPPGSILRVRVVFNDGSEQVFDRLIFQGNDVLLPTGPDRQERDVREIEMSPA